MAFLTDPGEQALVDAISTLEAHTSAELVVVVRPNSGDYLANDLLVGLVGAFATLAVMLFAPMEFGLATILLGPAATLVALVAGLRAVPGLRALFIGDARAHAAVTQAAQACAFGKQIHTTRERTGLLIYASLLEQRVIVLADVGIGSRVPEPEWRAACRPIEAVFDDEGDASLLAERILALATLLERACPRRDDDTNELSNEVDT